MKLSVIILTYNEELHIRRCISSIKDIADEILVVDCFSIDSTVEYACICGARVVQKKWVNHSEQFNWALTQLDDRTDWVLRIDADEILTSLMAEEIKNKLSNIKHDIDGIYCARWITFMGRQIKYGGVLPIRVLRLFRYGRGECENRWMDEHIKINSGTIDFEGGIIDENLNPLSWWIEKHNNYASLEVIDLLNLQYNFVPFDSVAKLKKGDQAGIKRWLKEVIYSKLPEGFRAFVYFFYRYFIRLGFLDGRRGLAFHFLQGFWYRYLVDLKLFEVKNYMQEHNVDARKAINKVLGIKV